jgi:hypothetical protein
MVIRTRVIRYLRKDVDIKVTPKNSKEYMTEGKVSLALSVITCLLQRLGSITRETAYLVSLL